MSKFNVSNGQGQWACAHPTTASLKPVPPGHTRLGLYCHACPFKHEEPGCLFTPTRARHNNGDLLAAQNRKSKRKRSHAIKVKYRAQGLNESGNPLTPSCWNCAALRQSTMPGRYVCGHAPDEPSQTRGYMIQQMTRNTGCTRFEMRLVLDIPHLDDDLAPSAVEMYSTTSFLSESGGDPGQVVSTAEGMSPPLPTRLARPRSSGGWSSSIHHSPQPPAAKYQGEPP